MKFNIQTEIDGSRTFDINNAIETIGGVALYNSETGQGGIDYIPADGETVVIRTGEINTSTQIRDLQPTLNNKAYYLVSNTLYSSADKDTIISLATEIKLSLVSLRYEGSFIFSNPDDFEYLYIIWDYTDVLDNTGASFSGGEVTKYIDVDLGSDVGTASIDIVAPGVPSRFVLEWNGTVVGDTGYIGLNSSANYDDLIDAGIDPSEINLVEPLNGLTDNGTTSLEFRKNLPVSKALLTVYSPLPSVSWSLTKNDPSRTEFYAQTTFSSTASAACGGIPQNKYWHNGVNALPVVGDIIYINVSGTETLDGSNLYSVINTTQLFVPIVSGASIILVDSDGVVIEKLACDCAEIAVPTITAMDIYGKENKEMSVGIVASNNPTSWEIQTTHRIYDCYGGEKGALFQITNLDASTKYVTVDRFKTVELHSSAAPTITGSGTATDIGSSTEGILPKGLKLDLNTGVISGIPVETCEFTLSVTATNCFGESTDEDITISIESGLLLKPFAMDVENVTDSGTDACALTAIYSLMYHNGRNTLPVEGDTIYKDDRGIETFTGGEMWYNVNDSAYSIKVCGSGKICDTHTC